MFITGRVVGEPSEREWTPEGEKEPITLRNVTVLDTDLKQPLECSVSAADWEPIARLHDNDAVRLRVVRLPRADARGRIKFPVQVVAS